ncbi:DNA repair protein RecO [Crenobacter intestini]|uniref:DNA repair protein RecO n=2 Tax=Crenobacter intestini TaxID=2563443 RepID=A0A4V4N974_9NEIS|nr:DNA repair protein RecO [Crenobacter intestini]
MQPGKVDKQRAYILHAQPYRETSLLLDVLTAAYGRVALVARGARRPRAELRGLLMPFQPLRLSWFGKNEVKTVHGADWVGGVRMLEGQALVCGFYLNELTVRLVLRDEPSDALFAAYDEAVRALASPGASHAAALRRYEIKLLQAQGYAPALCSDAAGEPLDAAALYRVHADASPERWLGGTVPGEHAVVRGSTLLALAGGELADAHSRREARQVTRLMLANILGDAHLASRALLPDPSLVAPEPLPAPPL